MLAERCGITTSAVSQWRDVPREHVEAVKAVAAELRPDLFPAPTEAA